jgi:transcription antitermination factor NusG
MQKNWYAVYTKPHCELKVAAFFSKKKIDSYCPLNRVDFYYLGKRKTSLKPLFPSIVFVNITGAQLPFVRQAADVINCLYWLGKPAVIKEQEVKALQYFTSAYNNVVTEKIAVNMSGLVRTVNEPVLKHEKENGSLKELINIKLYLPALGYMLIAEAQAAAETYPYTYEGAKMVS